MGKQCQILFFWAPKSLQIVIAAKKLKGAYSLEKHLSTMPETRVQSLGREDPLEKEMAIHSNTIAW